MKHNTAAPICNSTINAKPAPIIGSFEIPENTFATGNAPSATGNTHIRQIATAPTMDRMYASKLSGR